MQSRSFIFVNFITASIIESFLCQSSMPKGCDKSLGARSDGSLNASAFSGTSYYRTFLPSKGRVASGSGWIPESFRAINDSNPDYLQVDLGELKRITAVETEGYSGYYVNEFQLWHSKDGIAFSLYQIDGVKEFTVQAPETTMHYLTNPITARHVRFVPKGFKSYIVLKVDIFGCNSTIQMNDAPIQGIFNLTVDSVSQTSFTVSWKTIGDYSEQTVSYKPHGGPSQYKVLTNEGKTVHQERIWNLKPCTEYLFTVEMKDKNASYERSINITTQIEAPEKPVLISATSPQPFTAFIKWKPPSSTGNPCRSNITEYRIEYEVSGSLSITKSYVTSQSTECHIKDLRPWLKYTFKVYAVGEFGTSTEPAVAEIEIDGKAPEQPVKITSLQSQTLDSFDIEWENPPLNTVNGPIKNYAVFYKRKQADDWNHISTAMQRYTVKPLTPGTIYQVKVAIYNERYNIQTGIREIFVGRKGPFESKELTDSVFVASPTHRVLRVSWTIPESLMREVPEAISIKLRKLGEQVWTEEILQASNSASYLHPSNPFHVYECVFTLNTTKAIYFTQTKQGFIQGSSEDQKKMIDVVSVVSTSPGKAIVTVKIPEQYVKYTRQFLNIRYQTYGSGEEKLEISMTAKAEESFEIAGLRFWEAYNIFVIGRFTFAKSQTPLLYSSAKRIMVIGYSPGKAPSNVIATKASSTSIKVEWTRIPQEYIYGTLREYAIFFSSENATIPGKESVPASYRSTIITRLQPDTTYSIQVAGVNGTGGVGPQSEVASAKTFKDPRTPVLDSATAVSETDVLVKWKQPIEAGQTYANFRISFIHEGKTFSVQERTKRVQALYSERFEGLLPNTLYTVVIYAFKVENSVKKLSDVSNRLQVKTLPAPPPPTPSLIRAEALSSDTINVEWKSYIDIKSKWLNFTVIAVDETGQVHKGYLLTARSDSDKRKERVFTKKLGKLQPFHLFKVHVFAVKESFGEYLISENSNELAVKTLEAAPSAPLDFNIEVTKQSQKFSWKRPQTPNGVIRSYMLELYDKKTNKVIFNETIPVQKHDLLQVKTFEIGQGLKKYHEYRALLRAVTVVPGTSAENEFISVQGRPSSPRITRTTFNGTHILMKWRRPLNENGIIQRYQIKVLEKMPDGNTTERGSYRTSASPRTFIVKERSYGSEVIIKIAAETVIGAGPFSNERTIFIDPKKEPKPKAPPHPTINLDTIGSTSMVIMLKPLVTMTYWLNVNAYQVIVEKVNGGALQRRAVSGFPETITNHSTAAKNGDRFYIAAEFATDSLPDEFVVGDGKSYNGYQNAPLIPGTLYEVHVRAVATNEDGNLIYGATSSVRLPTTAQRKVEKKSEGGVPLPVVAGIAGALLLLIILVVIIIFYLRTGSAGRRRSKGRSNSSDVELSKLRTQVDPGEQRPISLTGDFPLYPDHLPIAVGNYNNHVSKMLRNKASGFRCEYNQLEMGKEYSWEMAHLQENKPKNRFANIVAYDHARVILGRINGQPASDYINASYIDGYMKPNAYVATQGPLPATFNDFWRMVWELRASVIVMLTNLQEKNKLKCHKYWPDDCVEYGEIIVTQTRKEMYADYIIRTFLLDRTDSPESREVKQFHFTVWPDHGVPKYATALLAFRRRVRSHNMPDSGPTIVHCSAGVGRTGTYIALDATLDRMNVYGDVDVFNFVAAMRTRRIAMVQTEEQYIFIHNAILESVQCGNTEITAHELRFMINKLEQVSPETKMNGFENEWKTLNNVSPIPSKSSCNIAALPENMPKNRNQNSCILPADNSLVRLLTIEDDESTAYINAVYVDGYKQRNAFILTQAPLKNTVYDFWRMLCEHKSASVILLCSLDEGEDFLKFWPEMHIREYEMITVECLSKVRGNEGSSLRNAARQGESDLITRQFRVEDSRYPEYPMMVKLFQYVGWSETKVPSTCNHVIQLINHLERWQQQSGNGPITIVCSDGLGRSGTFAALNAVLERVKVEQVVDVFQAVKAMRIQRAHLVKTLEQYKFIYSAVEGYLDAFDDYANFK